MLSSIHISTAFREKENWHRVNEVEMSFFPELLLKNTSPKSHYLYFIEKAPFRKSAGEISHPFTRDLEITFQGITSSHTPCELYLISYKNQKKVETYKISLGTSKILSLRAEEINSLRLALKVQAYETCKLTELRLEHPRYRKLSAYLFLK